MLALAEVLVRQHIAVTGVQPKLSLTIVPAEPAGQPAYFTIVGALGVFWPSYSSGGIKLL